mmetsp:Transcript_39454/g.97691  ORF Transcript_39454/g.97691 Transcript_39454/m.97691 type:complete len:310 (-) Transcript_39454:1399-2328(-)
MVISQLRKSFAALGSAKAGKSVYTQSFRDSGMGGTTNWWNVVCLGALAWSLAPQCFPMTQLMMCAPSSSVVACTMLPRCSGAASSWIFKNRSLDVVYITTLTSRADKYNAMARPSLLVAPVRKISLTSPGIFCRIAAAVSVLPCTTRTRKFGCLSTNICPPPLSASFLFRAPSPITLVPIASASRMACSIFLLMWLNSLLMKNWNPHAGVTHVWMPRCNSRCLSATNGLPISRRIATKGMHSGRKGCSHHVDLKGREENERSAKGRWNRLSSSVPCAMNTTSGALLGAASPRMAFSYSWWLVGSMVPYT